jgi:hypothetical protein
MPGCRTFLAPLTRECTMVIPSRRSGMRSSVGIRKTRMACYQAGYAFRRTFPPMPADVERVSLTPLGTRESAWSPTHRNCMPCRVPGRVSGNPHTSPPGTESTEATSSGASVGSAIATATEASRTGVPDEAGVCLFGRAFPNRLDFSGSRAILVAWKERWRHS